MPSAVFQIPRAEMAIPACSVGNFRVRRLRFPHAAFYCLRCRVEKIVVFKSKLSQPQLWKVLASSPLKSCNVSEASIMLRPPRNVTNCHGR